MSKLSEQGTMCPNCGIKIYLAVAEDKPYEYYCPNCEMEFNADVVSVPAGSSLDSVELYKHINKELKEIFGKKMSTKELKQLETELIEEIREQEDFLRKQEDFIKKLKTFNKIVWVVLIFAGLANAGLVTQQLIHDHQYFLIVNLVVAIYVTTTVTWGFMKMKRK